MEVRVFPEALPEQVTMTKSKSKRYVVVSEGCYLKSLLKAVAGEGTEGGAFTTDPRKARKYKSKREAEEAASYVYQGIVEAELKD